MRRLLSITILISGFVSQINWNWSYSLVCLTSISTYKHTKWYYIQNKNICIYIYVHYDIEIYNQIYIYFHISGWWFQIFFFTPTWGRFPFWLTFFKWVETTNQICITCIFFVSFPVYFFLQRYHHPGLSLKTRITFKSWAAKVGRCFISMRIHTVMMFSPNVGGWFDTVDGSEIPRPTALGWC